MRRREIQLFAVVGVVRGGFVVELGERLVRGFWWNSGRGANTNANANSKTRYEKLTDLWFTIRY